MSKESKKELLDLVKKYHKIYKEYDSVFEKSTLSREDITKQLLPMIESGSSTDESFKDIVKKIYIDNAEQVNDVVYYSDKFFITTDAFLLTSEENLPEDISKDYLQLKNKEYQPTFVISKGKFLRKIKNNQSVPQETFDMLFREIKQQLKGNV